VASIDHETIYVTTDQNAYELQDAVLDADVVTGVRAHKWPITTCEYDATQAQLLPWRLLRCASGR
jgi:hypothetical protein